MDLAKELDGLDEETKARLKHHGFSRDRLLAFAKTLTEGSPEQRRDERNRVKEAHAPKPDELASIPESDTERLRAIGRDALANGKVALCVMAGGMATRMGGVVKALVEAFDGKTFLDVRLAENQAASKRAGRPVPLWLMTSDATDGPIREALSKSEKHIETFVQDLSVRLTADGKLFRDASGHASTYATGHGDLPDALIRSGILDRFLANGGEIVWITNLDNLGATIDEVILGFFVESKKDVIVEVAPKEKGDKGGIPVHANGKLQVLEEFRLPKGFDPTTVDVFNTNTFLVRANALRKANIPWTFFEVEKKVDGKSAVQFERLLQEITSVLSSGYLRVPREGTASRFEPVKDIPELERRRPRMRAIAKARGFA